MVTPLSNDSGVHHPRSPGLVAQRPIAVSRATDSSDIPARWGIRWTPSWECHRACAGTKVAQETCDSLASVRMFSVETRTVTGQVTALGSAGSFTLVVDRPTEAGGGGKGFNGGQLLYLAVAGCISNDLFREAPRFGVELDSVRVTVEGDFSGNPAVSDAITYDVELSGSGDLEVLVREVDRIAEIPNSLRQGTPVSLREIVIA